MTIIPHYLILISNCIQFFQQKTHVRKHKRFSVVPQKQNLNSSLHKRNVRANISFYYKYTFSNGQIAKSRSRLIILTYQLMFSGTEFSFCSTFPNKLTNAVQKELIYLLVF